MGPACGCDTEWIQFPDQQPPNLSFYGSESYSSVDGPEIDRSIVPQLPVAGTGTYTGQAEGPYTYMFGSDWVRTMAIL